MNLDDLFEIVVLLYFVGRWVRNAVGGRRSSESPPEQAPADRRGDEAPSTPTPFAPGDRESPEHPFVGVRRFLQKLLDDAVGSAKAPEPDPSPEPVFEPLLRRASLLRGRAGQMLAEGGRRPAFEPVRRVVEGRLIPDLDALRGRLGAAALRMEDGTATDEDWGLLEDVDVRLRDVASRLSHLATWWLSRHDPEVGAFLDEADRLVDNDVLVVGAPEDRDDVAVVGLVDLGLDGGVGEHREGVGLQESGGEAKAEEHGRNGVECFHGSKWLLG